MAKGVFRWSVPVDHESHTFSLTGPVLKVATRFIRQVEFWTLYDEDAEPVERNFQVVGTGYSFPDNFIGYVGTALEPNGDYVWHLIEVEVPDDVQSGEMVN